MAEAPWYYNASVRSGKLGSQYALFLHDVVYLYLMTVNETITQRKNPRSGTVLFKIAQTITFDGITGRVVMDKNADRDPNYWIWHMVNGSHFQMWTEVKMIDPPGKRIKIDKTATWNTADHTPPKDLPKCGFYNELCPVTKSGVNALIAGLTAASFALIGAAVFTYVYIRKRKLEETMKAMLWKVKCEDIVFLKAVGRSSTCFSTNTLKSMASLIQCDGKSTASFVTETGNTTAFSLAYFRGVLVSAQRLTVDQVHLGRDEHLELNAMRQLTCDNLNTFVGACLDPPNVCILTGFCSRGSLQDILANGDIKLDWTFKISLTSDLVNGMHYLHHSFITSHGNLTSDSCRVDNRWVLKVCDFGLRRLQIQSKSMEEIGEYQYYKEQLWTAPELLRLPDKDRPAIGTKKGDVYSFAIVVQEIMCRCMPFDTTDPRDAIERVKSCESPPYRPDMSESGDIEMNEAVPKLVAQCWQEDPDLRPDFSEIRRQLRQITKGKKMNLVDNMLQIMEKYANNLEDIVDQRTSELKEEKKKTDTLLFRMLPESVAEQLKRGNIVQPEEFNEVTIYFSDIVGFTTLSSESTPLQVVDLLNDLYTLFDDIIIRHDVYKVETIGDAYMVVSGLPIPIKNLHAAHIADMALDLLRAVHTDFKIRHQPHRKLHLRIGLHSGPCVAGVVGLTMPRYCLFGDTVNMASRMESNGKPLHIHVSEATFLALSKIGGYHVQKRGEISVKGKGVVTTYWIIGKAGYPNAMLPEFDAEC